ncbi:ribosomal protein L7/L12 [Halobacillus sp. A5]|uniref:ribosomal protein L7/L12 n=1 Tax=Halobacillus sp. A5 TaxID=2880263 RepID=UPI0020A6D124|nr:ribosomal protein L7/L12 [Halobacillus sp. A5]MCP3028714.1 ribosomal protein L7/L12 [Halobacillus sp. A5]
MGTEVSILIITVCAVAIIWVLLSKNKKLNKMAYENINIESELESHVKNMISNSESEVKVIKSVREKTGLSLLQAKQYVEKHKK